MLQKNLAILIAGLLIGSALIAGLLLKPPSASQNEDINQSMRVDYLAAPPSYGPLIKTQPIQVKYKDNQAITSADFDSAKDIALNQKVILFDQEGNTLPLGGRIKKIEPLEDLTTIIVDLPAETQTELLSKNLEVITMETFTSARVPLSALQKDENGKNFIWITQQEDNEYGVRRQYLDIAHQNDMFFEESGYNLQSDTLIIINPDEKTNSSQKYTVQVTELAAPLHNPIKEAWIAFNQRYTDEEQAKRRQAAEDCRNRNAQINASGETTSNATSCGLPTENNTPDPFAIFKSLTTPEGTNACGNGGVSACGQ